MHLLLDIEGTITDPSGKETGDELIRAIRMIEESGTPVIFCSGRDIGYMEVLRGKWGLPPLTGAIAENGCFVAPHPQGAGGAFPDPGASSMDSDEIRRRLGSMGDVCEIDPFKEHIFSIYVPGYMNGDPYTEDQLRGLHSIIKRKMEGIDCQIVLTSASVELIPTGVDKGTGISLYCRSSGIEISDVIFLCDSNNDIEGARRVKEGGGRVGVVANGENALKELADVVSRSSYWKGALEIIDSFKLYH